MQKTNNQQNIHDFKIGLSISTTPEIGIDNSEEYYWKIFKISDNTISDTLCEGYNFSYAGTLSDVTIHYKQVNNVISCLEDISKKLNVDTEMYFEHFTQDIKELDISLLNICKMYFVDNSDTLSVFKTLHKTFLYDYTKSIFIEIPHDFSTN